MCSYYYILYSNHSNFYYLLILVNGLLIIPIVYLLGITLIVFLSSPDADISKMLLKIIRHPLYLLYLVFAIAVIMVFSVTLKSKTNKNYKIISAFVLGIVITTVPIALLFST